MIGSKLLEHNMVEAAAVHLRGRSLLECHLLAGGLLTLLGASGLSGAKLNTAQTDQLRWLVSKILLPKLS